MIKLILDLVLISAAIACVVYLVFAVARLGLDLRRERREHREAAEMLREYQKAHPEVVDWRWEETFGAWPKRRREDRFEEPD